MFDFDALDVLEARSESGCSMRCLVKSADKGNTELVREMLDCGMAKRAFACSAEEQAHPHAAVARQVQFMLEMETRAWLACHGFPLIEVWRRIREPSPWIFETLQKTIASQTWGNGHAVAAGSEVHEGPSFDAEFAAELAKMWPEAVRVGGHPQEPQFVEGNVCVPSFAEMLDRVTRRASQDADIFRFFVDLGSGQGHAALAAHALFPFRKCIGIELVPDIVTVAREALGQYESLGFASRACSTSDLSEILVQGDFLKDVDWSDASVVFANSVTWPRSLLQDVSTLALKLRRGAVLLVAMRPLPNIAAVWEAFEVRGEGCFMNFQDYPLLLWAYRKR